MKKLFVLTLLVFCITLPNNSAFAQVRKASKTTSVPKLAPAPSKTVLNYTLGETVPNIKECDVTNSHYKIVGSFSEFCLSDPQLSADGKYLDGFYILQVPKSEHGNLLNFENRSVVLTFVSGRVEGIKFLTNGLGGHLGLYDALTEKFGSPQVAGTQKVSTKGGDIYDKGYYQWKFTDLTITYVNVNDNIMEGIVEVLTPIGKSKQDVFRAKAIEDLRRLVKPKI